MAGSVFFEWPTDQKAESGFNAWFDNVLMRAYVDAADQNTTVYNGKTHATNALSSFQQNLDYAFDNYQRQYMLPINLLAGWNETTGDPNVTKGFHQLAFASEYAMLAVWHYRQAQHTANIGHIKHEATKNISVYDLLGRRVTNLTPQSSARNRLLVINGKKYIK